MTPETCENCGRVIVNLETPRLFNEHVVSAGCHEILSRPSPLAQPLTHQSPSLEQATSDWLHRRQLARPRAFVDYLFLPRMVFLGLFLLTAFLNMRSDGESDKAMPVIFFCCWLALGLVKIVMKGDHANSR